MRKKRKLLQFSLGLGLRSVTKHCCLCAVSYNKFKRSSKEQDVCGHVTITSVRFSPPSPPITEVGQRRAEGTKSKEGSLYLALAGNISPHQCVGDQ